MWWKILAVWLLCMAGAILNGTLREFVFNPWIGTAWGHVLSTVLLSLLILAITWSTIGWMAPASAAQAWAIGIAWFVLTLAFEFGFGRIVSHKSWQVLLADYHLWEGRIWVMVPLITAVAPVWMARLRGLIP